MSTPLLDPLDEARIRHAHREILETVGRLAEEVAAGPDGDAAAWWGAARAAVAFLRQGVPPVARWEESCYPPASPAAEDTGFEHAFLAAEADVLGGLLAAHAPDGAVAATDALVREVRRRLARIEAVLELHVHKVEDRIDTLAAHPAARPVRREARAPGRDLPAVPGTGEPAMGDEAAPDVGRGRVGAAAGSVFAACDRTRPRELAPADIDALLRRSGWAMLGTAGPEGPYAVPVAIAWDGGSVWFATGRGRKLDALRHDARACLTVAEVRDGVHWCSAVVEGRAIEVRPGVERSEALLRLVRQRLVTGQAAPRDGLRAFTAHVFRLRPTRIGGRARGHA